MTDDRAMHFRRAWAQHAFQVHCLPSADTEFTAAVHDAIAAIEFTGPDRSARIEAFLRRKYPRASITIRDPIAGFGVGDTWYAFRDGRATRQSLRRILIIDDDPAFAAVVAESLDDNAFEVRSALDGRAALELLATWTPSLILLDLSMPMMGGEEFAERYRELPPPLAPVVIVSGSDDAASRAEQIGARSVVAKPFELDALTILVNRYA